MAYNLYDENGWVANVATIQGYDDLCRFVDAAVGAGPLKEFLDKGETTNVGAVASEATQLMYKASELSVKSTLSDLISSLRKAKGIAIVSE